jgi:8-oxo-dGTP diphosphatase
MVYQFHGQSASCVLRRGPFLMHFQSALHIRGHAGVQRAIAAFQDIQVPRLLNHLVHFRIVANSRVDSKLIVDSINKRRYYFGMKKGIDYIGVGVGAIIFNKAGEVFLAKRGKEAQNEKHKWEFPGGSVEFGETLANALVREMREEYGFVIEVVQLLDVVDHILPDENQHWVSPTYLCRYKNGKPRILEPHKCKEIGWFDLKVILTKELTMASLKSLGSLKKYLSTG